MRRLFVAAGVSLLLLTQLGCLGPMITRMDRMNDELVRANTKLVEATETLNRMEQELATANRRLQSLDRFMKRFGGVLPEEE